MGEVEGTRINLIYNEFELCVMNPLREVSSGNMTIKESRERKIWEFLFCFSGSPLYSVDL